MKDTGVCWEDIIRHDEQIKTLFINLDKHENISVEALRLMNLKIDQLEKTANRFVIGALVLVLTNLIKMIWG